MRIRATTALLVSILGTATAAFAQTAGGDEQRPLPARSVALLTHATEVPDLSMLESPARLDELAQWIVEFSQWKTWRDEWGNRREPGWFTGFRQRRQL